MLWLLSKAQDIKSKQFPALTWEGTADGQALEPLRAYVIAQAEAAQDWYLRKRVWKRRGGLTTRLLAMSATAVGGGIPVVVQMYGENGKPWFSPAWASITLALAAFCVSLDYFLGYTSGWIRYLQAHKPKRGQGEFLA